MTHLLMPEASDQRDTSPPPAAADPRPRGRAEPLRARARALYHWVRLAPERLLHPRRRREAVARRRAAGRPSRVLVLCYGNICRSPYAEARLRALVATRGLGGVAIESGGFFGPGRPANDMAHRLAAGRDLDLSGHRSRLVDPSLGTLASLVLVMTRQQAVAAARDAGILPARIELLGDFDPLPIEQRDIPDPYGHPPEVFERVFDRIDRCLLALVETWRP